MEKYHKTLGVEENATREEIDEQYQILKKQYTEKMFAEGDEGAKAANFLQNLDIAYQDAIFYLGQRDGESQGSKYFEVESTLKAGNLEKAQTLLDKYESRDSEWHYYQSNLFYKKNWFTDSKKQLEISLHMDPSNEKSKTALEGLEKIMQGDNVEKVQLEQQQRKQYQQNGPQGNPQQMGGMGCNCCDCLCASLLCNMCGGC